MEGEIYCQSTPGLGSVFSFTAWFDLCQENDLEQCISCNLNNAATRQSYDFSAFHILLVEDNEVNQQLAIELLKDTGIVVNVASNGAEAVVMITDGGSAFDLVLMDIQMPVMDGYEATRLIRGDSRFAALPIIAMTAHAFREEQQKIIHAGMDGHITKPIDVRILLRIIGSFLGVQPPSDPASEKQTAGSSALHAYTELDVAGALDRLNGNETLYNWLLRSFVEKNVDVVKSIEEALSSGDSTLAARHAHTLKSSAGTIGAVELESLAQNLETAIEQGEPGERVNDALGCFAVGMERVLTSLASCSHKKNSSHL